jgi:hypothetical protein
MLTFTDVGSDWPTIRRTMERLRRSLRGRRVGMPMEWLYVVECNQGDDAHQHHIHALAHGSVPPPGVSVQEKVLSDLAQRVGFGPRVHIREADENAGWYLMKNFREPGLQHFLEINGGRPEHSSRGFWRVAGQWVGSREEAIRVTSEVHRRNQFRS